MQLPGSIKTHDYFCLTKQVATWYAPMQGRAGIIMVPKRGAEADANDRVGGN